MLSEIIRSINIENIEDDIFEKIEEANAILMGNEDLKTIQAEISTLTKDLLSGVSNTINFSIAAQDPAELMKALRLTLKQGATATSRELSAFGTGIQNQVLIALYKYQIQKDTENKSILMIEEPEAHLHPHAQKVTSRHFLAMSQQVIIATHSPIVLNAIPPDDIIRFHIQTNGSVAIGQVKNTYPVDLLKDFAKLYQRNQAEIMFARKVIIAEGHSEKILLPIFSKILGLDLDLNGISIMINESDDPIPLFRITHKDTFNIPSLVLFETDVLDTLFNKMHKSQLINKTVFQACTTHDSKRDYLEKKLGWIAVPHNFEAVLASAGYEDEILAFIKKMSEKATLPTDPAARAVAIAQLVKDKDKLPLANHLIPHITAKQIIPECYKKAIEWARSSDRRP